MNIESNFISKVVSNIHSYLISQDLCSYSDWTPENGNYDDEVYQGIYALRYLPAYYFEYAILADILNQRVNPENHKEIKIASFGCGLLPDHYALEHNLTKVPFSYTGYDASHWELRTLLPATGNPPVLRHQSIDTIHIDEIHSFDAFFFPKSIGDMSKTSNLDILAQKISTTKKNKLFFMNSFVTKANINNHTEVNLFNKIHSRLIINGFKTKDDHEKTCYKGDIGGALWNVNNSFNYPPGYLLCQHDESECTEYCTVRHSPILTNKNMGFQFLEYTR